MNLEDLLMQKRLYLIVVGMEEVLVVVKGRGYKYRERFR